MTLLGASVLFNRGSNLHNQLRVISNSGGDVKFKNLLRVLDQLYKKDNTRAVREELQEFILTYGEEVYREYSKSQTIHGEDDFNYTLKESNE